MNKYEKKYKTFHNTLRYIEDRIIFLSAEHSRVNMLGKV